jgi:hypothetical protein
MKSFDDLVRHGSIGIDAIERISSRRRLDWEAKDRTLATWRIITAAMARHGWTPVRFRGVGHSRHREQLIGALPLPLR